MKIAIEMNSTAFGQLVLSAADALKKLEPSKVATSDVCDMLNNIPDYDCVKFPGGEVIYGTENDTSNIVINIEDDAVLRFAMPVLSKGSEILAGPYLTAKALLTQLRPLSENLKDGFRKATEGFRHTYEKPSKYAVMLIGDQSINVTGSVVMVRKDGYGNAPRIVAAHPIDKDLGDKYIKAQVDAICKDASDELFNLTCEDATKEMRRVITQTILSSKCKANPTDSCASDLKDAARSGTTEIIYTIPAPADSAATGNGLEKIVNPFNEDKPEAPKPKRKHRGGRRHRNKSKAVIHETSDNPEKTLISKCTYAVYMLTDTNIIAFCKDLAIFYKDSDGTIGLVNRKHISGSMVPNAYILEAAITEYKKPYSKMYFGVDQFKDATSKFDDIVKKISERVSFPSYTELKSLVDVLYVDYQTIKRREIGAHDIKIATDTIKDDNH